MKKRKQNEEKTEARMENRMKRRQKQEWKTEEQKVEKEKAEAQGHTNFSYQRLSAQSAATSEIFSTKSKGS